MEEASAIYEPMRYMGWIGSEPSDRLVGSNTGEPIPGDWREVVVSRHLTCGVGIAMQRGGFTIYDFANWPPGVSRRGRGPRTVGAASEAAKPALINRMRVMNAHLTLLHAAMLSRQHETPTVMRVNERDVYRHDYPEGGGDGFWFRPMQEPLPATIGYSERERLGLIKTDTVELSLRWLDGVVAADGALVDFDLLNQAQSALMTHDYALAVTAGWTVCELRLRRLGRGVTGGSERQISKVIAALERVGLIGPALRARLDDLRESRNSWLHSGAEPSEDVGREAALLGAELLRGVVPDLHVSVGRRLLIL